MEIRHPNPAVLTAAVAMLQPYVPNLSPESLVNAIESFGNHGAHAMPERPLTRRQVAEILQCSLMTVSRRINDGTLKKIRLTDRSVRIDPASVREFLGQSEPGVNA